MTWEEQLNSMFHEKLNEVEKSINIEELRGLQLTPTAFKISFDFIVFEQKKNYTFVVTGTKEEPAGISVTKADFVAILSNGVILDILPVEKVKKIIKANYVEFKKGIDEDYEHMGVFVDNEYLSSTRIGLGLIKDK